LSTDAEHAVRTRHPRIFVGRIAARERGAIPAILDDLRRLCEQAAADDAVREALQAALPEARLRPEVGPG
jgi:hypothetical protein